MSTARKLKLSPQQYLEQERRAPFKSEYYEGEVFAMAGASRRHNLITANLLGETRAQLKGRPCEAYRSDMRVWIESPRYYAYPDVVVVCGPPQFADSEVDTLLNPTVLIEVLSGSTESWDRGGKAASYRRLPSLQEYVLVSQYEPRVEHYQRQPGNRWLLTEITDLDGELRLNSLAVVLPLREIYARVEWDPEEPAANMLRPASDS